MKTTRKAKIDEQEIYHIRKSTRINDFIVV